MNEDRALTFNELRVSRNITQRDLWGIASPPTITDIERGRKTKVSFRVIEALAERCDVRAGEMFEVLLATRKLAETGLPIDYRVATKPTEDTGILPEEEL